MEQDRLTRLENLIARNQCRFHEIGKALKEIRDSRLYKLNLFNSFEAYARARWDMGKSQAYRVIEAYQVVNNLSPIGDILPSNESQVRPLVPLDPIEQRRIWKAFLKSAMEITAPNIKRFIDSAKKGETGNKDEPVDLTDQVSKAYMDAVQAMLEQVHQAQEDHWQKTSRQAGLLWNRVIREKILSKENGNGHG
ncbi:MAG: DNA methylase [Desulfobacteraceae bacterium]|nr:DNA methylase [Desulfobacteraceae bacterium]